MKLSVRRGRSLPLVLVSGTVIASLMGAPAQAISGVGVDQGPAFDRCSLPTTAQMQTWWTSSPYVIYGIYLGGANNNGCGHADSTWLSTVQSQGWAFAALWTGAQATCVNQAGLSHFSTDPTSAYNAGVSEANAAFSNATSKGFVGGNMEVYYDMEGFSATPGTCLTSVQNFVNGWVSRLHALGSRAGYYGSASGSGVDYMSTIANPPDDIWFGETVSGTAPATSSYINAAHWNQSQRIKQYVTQISTSFGGVTMSIDRDCADAHVNRPAAQNLLPCAY